MNIDLFASPDYLLMPLIFFVRQRRAKTINNSLKYLLIIDLFNSGLIAWLYNAFGIIKKVFAAIPLS